MAPNGSGTSPICIFPGPSRSSIYSTLASISGTWLASFTRARMPIRAWILRHQPKLDDGKIEKLVRYLYSLETSSPELTQTIRKVADYFLRNAERMRYPEFRRQHLFIGSGVIEAGCKTVIGTRLKQSGMFALLCRTPHCAPTCGRGALTPPSMPGQIIPISGECQRAFSPPEMLWPPQNWIAMLRNGRRQPLWTGDPIDVFPSCCHK